MNQAESERDWTNLIPLEIIVQPQQRDAYWWHFWFLGLARYVSTASKDPSTQCGAVIVNDQRRIVSVGYNGLPRQVADLPERLNIRCIKYKMIVHAECNAIIFAQTELKHCTLYNWPMIPCSHCAGMIIQSGISRCVAPTNSNPRWQEDIHISKQMFKEANVELIEIANLL